MTNQDAIRIIKTAIAEVEWEYPMEYAVAFNRAIEALEQEPKSDWIPVSERLPENGDLQVVTIFDEWGDSPFRYSDFGWYLETAKCWIVGTETRTDIVAWMPLPEPYKAESEDKECLNLCTQRKLKQIQ